MRFEILIHIVYERSYLVWWISMLTLRFCFKCFKWWCQFVFIALKSLSAKIKNFSKAAYFKEFAWHNFFKIYLNEVCFWIIFQSDKRTLFLYSCAFCTDREYYFNLILFKSSLKNLHIFWLNITESKFWNGLISGM